MQIIIEYSFFVSWTTLFFVLSLAGKILKKTVRLKWLSASFGSLVSLSYPLFHFGGVGKILLLIFSVSIVVLISFKYRKFPCFVRELVLIMVLTCVFGGICEAIRSLVGQFSLFVVCVIVIVCYVVLMLIHKSIDRANKIKSFTFNLRIVDDGKEVREEGYLDSGNVLYDSITKKPIILINFDVFHKIYENISFVQAMTKSYDCTQFKNGHFQKINSVGGVGKILVFSVDEVDVGEEKSFKDVMLGLSFSGFEKSFGKNVLLSCALV